MPGKKIAMKPKKSAGKIVSLQVGPKWTYVKIRLSTKRLSIQTGKKAKR